MFLSYWNAFFHLTQTFDHIFHCINIFSYNVYLFSLLFQHADPSFTDIWLGTALIIVILVTGIFSYIKESQQASIQREIERLVPRVARVVRECIETEVPAEELVLGKDYSSFGWCSYIGMYLKGGTFNSFRSVSAHF